MKTVLQPKALDYRSPGTSGLGGDLIYRWLAARHCLGVFGAVLGILAGLAVAVASAWIASAFIALLGGRLSNDSVSLGWPSFWTLLFVGMPLLIWRTIRTGGEFYEQQVSDSNLFPGKPLSHGKWSYRAEVATTALYGDLLFWGPRLIVDGFRRLGGREVTRSASHLRRASYVLSHLLQSQEVVRTKALRFPKEPLDTFQRSLRWLEAHDYIGISTDGQRVWMGSLVREGLCNHLHIEPKRSRREAPKTPQETRYMDKQEMVDIIFKR